MINISSSLISTSHRIIVFRDPDTSLPSITRLTPLKRKKCYYIHFGLGLGWYRVTVKVRIKVSKFIYICLTPVLPIANQSL